MADSKGHSSEEETPPKQACGSAQRKPTINFNDSHVTAMYSHFTPPSRFTKLANPFEARLAEKFHTPIFSPSVFKVSSQQVEDTFKLTIDEISHLKPVDFDEAVIEQFDNNLDLIAESSVQAKIDVFFSKFFVPSPYNQESRPEPLVKEIETPVKDVRRTCEKSTQTALSLPFNLPPELENALKPYFNAEELECLVEDEEVDMVLYKKLFDIEECDRSDGETVQSSPPKSLILSPLAPLPQHLELDSSFNLDECNLSPIRVQANSTSIGERRTTIQSDYEEQMSVDATASLVPDVCGDMPKTEYNSFDYSYVSMREGSGFSESVVNWDVEYNKIEVSTPTKNTMEMDVSNSNTPKSSFGYRKKLSTSFANEEKPQNYVYKSYGDSTDLTDPGYHTGGITLEDNQLNIFASTPSKRQVYRIT